MVDILAIGAHPDDIEFACGALLFQAVANGQSVALVDCTLGEKGSHGIPEERKQEALAAAKMLDAPRLFLSLRDCEVVDNYDNRLELVRVIRQLRPQLILAPLWEGTMNHPDHLACGRLARNACRYARFSQILPDLLPHRPKGILHYLPAVHHDPDVLVDVSDYVDKWKDLINCHKSQMQTLDYLDRCLRRSAQLGAFLGVAHAQGLVTGNPIVVDNLLHIAQGTVEL